LPEELYSPVVEITVTHEHADGEPTVEYGSGILINRHIWPGRSIKEYKRITRDSPGQDETPDGTCLPLALFPRKTDVTWRKQQGLPWGGELLTPEEREGKASKDPRTRHQRQWDYLQGHVDKALARYCENYSNLWVDPEDDSRRPKLTVEEMSDWQKINAICNYATAWQWRGKAKWDPWPSRHPVDVLHYGHHCVGTSRVVQAMLHVAGFESRILINPSHTWAEVRVSGKWVHAEKAIGSDRGSKARGSEIRSCHGWAEITAEPDLIAMGLIGNVGKAISREHTWYLTGSMMYWLNMGGIDEYRQTDRTGIEPWLAYNPSTASALYPTMRVHIFHVRKDEPPTLSLSRRQAGGIVKIVLDPGMALRKRFYLSDCRDNPIVRGQVAYLLKSAVGTGDVRCELDGLDLGAGAPDTADKGYAPGRHFYLVFEMSSDRLTPGEHDLVLRNASDKEIMVAFQPDVVRPYHNPVSGKEIVLSPSDE
jgi:hypothetical protein